MRHENVSGGRFLESEENLGNFYRSLRLSLDMAGFHICETRPYMEFIELLTMSGSALVWRTECLKMANSGLFFSFFLIFEVF